MKECECSYIKFSDGEVVHSINCSKSSFFNLENRHGFTSIGIEDVKDSFKKLEQELAKLKEENEKLKAELFNQKEHYEVLKENYDNVFIFMAEKTDRTITECFDRYKDWLAK